MGHYVMIDLEMAFVRRKDRKDFPLTREIIQIGAALMDESYQIVDTYSCFVRPQKAWINEYIKQLTGICGNDVTKACSLEEALRELMRWLPDDVTAVSWSNSDEKQIREEMGVKEIHVEGIEELLDNWLDCQPMFSERMGNNRAYRLTEALVAADIDTIGKSHNGMDDAYNTALLFAKMMSDKEFALNPYYEKANTDSQTSPLHVSMGELFARLNLEGLVCA